MGRGGLQPAQGGKINMTETFEPAIEVAGSLFEYLGFEDAKALDAKAELLVRIQRTMRLRGLNQSQLANAIGMDKSEASKLLRGNLDRFSIERLMKALRDLGAPVRISWVDDPMPSTARELKENSHPGRQRFPPKV